MFNWLWCLIVIFFGAILFGIGGSSTVTSSATMVEINGNPGVVLDASTYSSEAAGWTPSIDDLQAAEDAIFAVAPSDDRLPALQGYRQYVGIVEEGDRKIVVNSMCSEMESWEETYIDVMDGGPCYWNALYNIETDELEYLIVNGEA